MVQARDRANWAGHACLLGGGWFRRRTPCTRGGGGNLLPSRVCPDLQAGQCPALRWDQLSAAHTILSSSMHPASVSAQRLPSMRRRCGARCKQASKMRSTLHRRAQLPGRAVTRPWRRSRRPSPRPRCTCSRQPWAARGSVGGSGQRSASPRALRQHGTARLRRSDNAASSGSGRQSIQSVTSPGTPQ